MDNVLIRKATPADQLTIRAMVRAARLNPINLRWPNFVVADDGGHVVGAGQLRPYGDGSRELASLAVIPIYQRLGIGGRIVRQLLADQRGPIYLMCEHTLEGYYERFGFRAIEGRALPKTMARMHRMGNLLMSVGSWLSRQELRISAMRWEGDKPSP
ncbi:MAG: GNAT family N-acetyltransferase [Chloroflexi bacterium]|nr:GNAT family N-acetyltransferase [Chloroflexota bacterium]